MVLSRLQWSQWVCRVYGFACVQINEGDGAFYGPKIDISVSDALKRKFQCATLQVPLVDCYILPLLLLSLMLPKIYWWMPVDTAWLPAPWSLQIGVLSRRRKRDWETCYDTQSYIRVCWAYVCYIVRALQREVALLAKSASSNCLPRVREIPALCTTGNLAHFSSMLRLDVVMPITVKLLEC